MLKLAILTGPSGSGVSSARYVFEELGYYIVENAPKTVTRQLLKDFSEGKYNTEFFCLMVNISDARDVLKDCLDNQNFETTLVLLNASKEAILKRYTLTRHAHPRSIMRRISLENAIDLDLKEAIDLSPDADFTVDTTSLSVKGLRTQLYNFLENEKVGNKLSITFMSFGLKNGTPLGLDMVLDTRTLANPYWVDELKSLTGDDQPVIDYLMSFPETQIKLERLISFLEEELAEVQESGKPSYNVGIACSGGQHRSPFVATYLSRYFAKTYKVRVIHRDAYENDE